jgi:uncharacterized lipoprotein YmbA
MRLPVVFGALVTLACGGKLPDTRYYQLAVPAAKAPAAEGALVLALEPLATDPAYDDERIVYRTSPYRLDYYQYHRWSAPPGVIVGNFLEASLERTGKLSAIVAATDGAPAVLGGRVVAIEEVDAHKDRWLGRIVVELVLTDGKGKTLWSAQFEETEPLARQSPEGLARGLSIALARIVERASPAIVDAVRAQTDLQASSRNR